MLRVLRASLRTAAADLAAVYSWKSWTFGWLLRVVAQVTFFALIGVLIGSREQVEFLLIGAVGLVIAMANMNAVASTTWERRAGTLGLLVAAPLSPLPVFVGRSAQWIVDGFLSGGASLLIVGALMLGFPWGLGQVIAAIAVVAFTSVCAYCFSLFLAALVVPHPSLRTVVSSLGYLSMAVLCGVTVPLDFLPGPIAAAANVIPLTHGVAALRHVLGGDLAAAALPLAIQAFWAGVWLLLAVFAIRALLERGRQAGTLEWG